MTNPETMLACIASPGTSSRVSHNVLPAAPYNRRP